MTLDQTTQDQIRQRWAETPEHLQAQLFWDLGQQYPAVNILEILDLI